VRFNDRSDDVRVLQRGLNKLGCMLVVDGHYGKSTRDAIATARQALGCPGPADEADARIQQLLADLPELFPEITSAGATFIARAEVTSASEYQRVHQRPTWPSAASGMTIGIGYDLQFATPQSLTDDWSDCLAPAILTRLSACTKKPGTQALVAQLADITVPLFGAVSVFARRSLPKYWDLARGIYPQIADAACPPARRTALVSLVFNRGARLQDKNPVLQERREMRAIQQHLAAGNVDAVAGDLEAMTRVWAGQNLGGLIQRRRDEATLWRSGFRALNLE
jgi:hypothetical protein